MNNPISTAILSSALVLVTAWTGRRWLRELSRWRKSQRVLTAQERETVSARLRQYAGTTIIVALCLAAAPARANEAGYKVLYRFEKDSNENSGTESMRLLAHNGALYGMTRNGGPAKKGTLFRVNPDGSGFRVLHEFVGGDTDGHSPCGSLIGDGQKLYGMTTHGGRGKGGVVFQMNPDGTSYTILHHFLGWNNDGDNPYGSLTLEGNFLFGLTARGGPGNNGVLFRMKKDGSAFTPMHVFAGGRNDGATPYGSVTLDNGLLYGMTFGGGNRNGGVLFCIKPSGNDYKILHHFAGSFDNGSNPTGSLIAHGGSLYGTTSAGGTGDKGIIFRIQRDGTGFAPLHSFNSNGDKGNNPRGTLAVIGDTLYGATRTGGTNAAGVLFSLQPDQKRFNLLHRFSASTDGSEPAGPLTVHNNALYGMTTRGANGGGALFCYPLQTP